MIRFAPAFILSPILSSIIIFAVALPAPAEAQQRKGGAQGSPQGRVTYCCTGDNGKKICSDVLPQECYNRAYREVDSRGLTIREFPAPPTPEERAARAAEEKQAAETETRRKEQARKDRALLDTYASEQDIDDARDRATAGAQKRIQAARDKHAVLMKRKTQLDAEAAPHKGKPLPPELDSQIRANRVDLKTEQATIDGGQSEIEQIKARYDDEKRRYREASNRPPAQSGGASSGDGNTAAPRSR
ncbi:MAG: hypothetical protein LBE33_07005 [Zoogloeaceae bacterium]|jgi:hypothetical protein|nr:hypothetical protein [Zoogloeaceae bacterium]